MQLRADEEGLTRGQLWAKYVAPVLKEIGDPESVDWPSSLKKYDNSSFTQFLSNRGASPGAISILRLGFVDLLGEGADALSALDVLREALPRSLEKHLYVIRGGSDTLPKAMAAKLDTRIRYGCAVVRIEQNNRGARVIYSQSGVNETITCQYVIAQSPFPYCAT